MGEPRPHPIRNALAATAAAGVMLTALAGCSAQSPTTREKEPVPGATADSAHGAPMGTIVLASGTAAPDGAVRAGPEYTAGKSLGDAEKLKSSEKDKPLYLALPQRYLGF
jgi:hypothetical protein